MAKYSVPDGHWDAIDEADSAAAAPPVSVGNHALWINDEREEIERYDGLQWWFIIEDGTITGIDLGHYCPGPSHIDPMGFRAWDDVPEAVQRVVLRELNADSAEDVVDFEACAEVAEGPS